MINLVCNKIKSNIQLILFKIYWRKINFHNKTTAGNLFPVEKVTVGKYTYGQLNVNTYGNDKEKLNIGSYCSIAGEVKFLLGGEHPYKGLSTYPFKKHILNMKENTYTKGPIMIEDDVWIGERTIILSGVTIGQGSIIAAGSVVSKDIPHYAIFAGGKVVKYRFSPEIINKLKKFNFDKLDEEKIKGNIGLLCSDLDFEMLDNSFFQDSSTDGSK